MPLIPQDLNNSAGSGLLRLVSGAGKEAEQIEAA